MEIRKEAYEPDVELLDRYQAFSGELVRISLAGVGLAGFYLSASKAIWNSFSGWAVAIAALAFAASAALALGHRYYSTDGIYHHLKSLRAGDPAERAKAGGARNGQFRRSGKMLLGASIAAAVGALAAGAALLGVVASVPS